MNKYKYLALGLWFTTSIAGAATLSISPGSGTYASGDNFTVNILLDTTGSSIDGVDVRYLRFNPNVLQVVDSNSNTSGVQVMAGTLMASTLTNTVDNQTGLITFSQIVPGGQRYQGSGTLFSVTFRAISGGSSSITFDAASGATTDSNVASAGVDVLSSANPAQFTISGTVSTNPSTPTPPNTGTALYLTRTIYVGSRGSDVTTLQNFLISAGYLAGGSNSGYFGQLTRAAVQKYQCDKGIVCSGDGATTGYGTVGARTRALLNGGTVVVTPTSPGTVTITRIIYLGSRGSDVTALQNFLIARGYLNLGSNTGYFGQLTRAAVQKYQCDKGIVCSGSEVTTGYGKVGARTRASINQ